MQEVHPIERAKLAFMFSHKYPPEYGLLTELLLKSGSRPRALLALTGRNCTREGLVVIPQGKGSATLTTFVTDFAHMVTRVAGTDKPLFPTLDYYSYRRACLREGVRVCRRGYTYANVCSLFREHLAREVVQVTGEVRDGADAVGHRARTSTAHYLGTTRDEVKRIVKETRKR